MGSVFVGWNDSDSCSYYSLCDYYWYTLWVSYLTIKRWICKRCGCGHCTREAQEQPSRGMCNLPLKDIEAQWMEFDVCRIVE